MFSFQKMKIYQLAKELAIYSYQLTEKYPQNERYAIMNQINRAAVSVPSNIAEGTSRRSNKEKLNFINIAYGSLMELVCQMEISYELKYITKEENDTIIQKTKNLSVKMSNYKNYLEKILDDEKLIDYLSNIQFEGSIKGVRNGRSKI